MLLKKNIKVGKIRLKLFFLAFFLLIFNNFCFANNNNGEFTNIKVLDKVSSKNKLLKLKNGEDFNYKDLLIKSIKCKNSEFDDNPEITAYIQVKDLRNKDKNDVFVFNGWMFSSSPSIAPFDHPVYDIWLVGCN
tara:strand:- start:423 stop:824 length:402 start_codon:yes stop_codon:yes gene_type:complete